MTPEVKARIFEPFYTTKSSEQGTGLGLAVVYGIVASHEGTIDVDTAPGAGSTFKIYLPLADEAPSRKSSPSRPNSQGGEETLLIVDDEAPLRLLLEASLSNKGYQVLTAADGPMAAVRLKDASQRIDAVLLRPQSARIEWSRGSAHHKGIPAQPKGDGALGRTHSFTTLRVRLDRPAAFRAEALYNRTGRPETSQSAAGGLHGALNLH